MLDLKTCLYYIRKIIDAGFHHYLTVWEDYVTRDRRLQATVAGGELKRVTIWIAFCK